MMTTVAQSPLGCFTFDQGNSVVHGWLVNDEGDALLLAVEFGGKIVATFAANNACPPPPEAPDNACGFRWDVPGIFLLNTKPTPIRLWHVSSGMALDGEALIEGPLPQVVPLPNHRKSSADCFAWTRGMAGMLVSGINEVVSNFWVEPDFRAKGGHFERVDGPTMPFAPDWGLRLAFPNAVSLNIHQKFNRPLKPGSNSFKLRFFVKLAKATENLAFLHADFFTSRWSSNEFERLRRVKRTRIFRTFAAIDLALDLTNDEFRLAEAGELFLSLGLPPGHGVIICPFIENPQQLTEGLFEDGGLDTAFTAAASLVNVHGPDLGSLVLPSALNSNLALKKDESHSVPYTQIIIAVYNGGDVVRECLQSVQKNTDTSYDVLVMDDGSRAYTKNMIEDFSMEDERFILHRRDINRGYTKTINEAVKLSAAEWVVVLNSDTIVSSGWLRKLHIAAQKVSNAGLVGPLSNAATWQSIPHAKNPDGSWSKNDFIDPKHVAYIQGRLDEISERNYPPMPVLNGFCTLISREVFRVCGLYDEEAFPMGYGEETDLCLRARRAGFGLIVADDCFVYHQKSVSFGSANRSRLTRAGGFELRNKHLGVNISTLEREMQNNPTMMRLRAKLANLPNELI